MTLFVKRWIDNVSVPNSGNYVATSIKPEKCSLIKSIYGSCSIPSGSVFVLNFLEPWFQRTYVLYKVK